MDDLYQEALLDLAENPHNYGRLVAADQELTASNASCGDSLHVWLKWNRLSRIQDIGWEGKGCIISQTAMSVVSDFVIGKTKSEIEAITLPQVLEMLHFDTISPGRVKCVSLGLETLKKML